MASAQELELRLAAVENQVAALLLGPTERDAYDHTVPAVSDFEVSDVVPALQGTLVTLTWEDSTDSSVAEYELWSKRASEANFSRLTATRLSPATVNVEVPQTEVVEFALRTLMADGRANSFEESPRVAATVTKAQVGSGDLADGSVGDAKLDRVTDPIIIVDGDIAAVNATKISGLILANQIDTITASQLTGLIQSNQIGSIDAATITVGQLTSVQIASVNAATITVGQITSAQILSLATTKLTGLITAAQIDTVNAGDITGSIIAGQIGSIDATTITINLITNSQISSLAASKISAGTMTAVNISGGTYLLVNSPNRMVIDGLGFEQENTTTGRTVNLYDGIIQVGSSGSGQVTIQHESGDASHAADSGSVRVTNTLESTRAELRVTSGDSGEIILIGDAGVEAFRVNCGGGLGQTNSGYVDVQNSSGTSKVEIGVDSAGDGGVRFNASSTLWALWANANGKKLVEGNSTTGVGGSVSVSTGLTAVDVFVVCHVSGGTPDRLLNHDTPSGGSVTVRAADTSGTAQSGVAFDWLAMGDP